MLKKRCKKESVSKYILIFPSLIGVLIFYVIPYILMFGYLIVGNVNLVDRFLLILNNSVFQLAAKNTLVFTLVSVPLIVVLSMLIAIALNKNILFRSSLRTVFILPLVLPVASIILFFEMFFDLHGVLNYVCNIFDIESINWINSEYAMIVIVIIYIWKNVGYNIILFLAGLQNIPVEYYEAANLDGAGKYKIFRHITVIYLMPTTFFVFIISIINSFKVFKEVYILTGSYPHNSIYMLQHYMNNLFHKLEYSKLVTAASIMSFFIVCVVWLLFRIQKKIIDIIS